MIDDDFNRLVRRMFEDMFGDMIPSGSKSAEMRFRIANRDSDMREVPSQNEIIIEKIDLDDTFLVVIEGLSMESAPMAHIEGRELVVKFGNGQVSEKIEIPFAVDSDDSSMSFNNGIAEIKLAKAKDPEKSSDYNEIVLRSD